MSPTGDEARARLRLANEMVARRREKLRDLKAGALGLVELAGDRDIARAMLGDVLVCLPGLADSAKGRRRAAAAIAATGAELDSWSAFGDVSERVASEILRALGRDE